MKPRSSSSQNDDVIDDPCWGDPEHCSLGHLLTLLHRNKCILHESRDYIMMHKPADLRMDGEYPATVHKLITYWYPPPSLLKSDESSSLDDNNNSKALLQQIAQMHRHSETPDKEVQVRPCHQLDYATSGVLLLARNTAAASHASICFEHRQVQKAYRAVLQGQVQPDPTWPILPSSLVTAFLQHQEEEYKRAQHKKRRPSKANSFNGFQPPHAFFQIWQGRYARQQIKKRKRNEKLSEDQWTRVNQALNLSEEDCQRMAQLPWKQLKSEAKLKQAMVRGSELYNQFLKVILNKEDSDDNNNDQEPLPTVFRVQGEPPNVFYIYLALAQVDDEFAMRIPIPHKSLATGDPTRLNFKVALTRCTLLSNNSKFQGQPVTKVQLEPRTGRRHQLRVHTAFLGHAIVGDQTYCTTGSDLSPRMCLHAYELVFPLPKNELDGTKDNSLLRVNAPDPFPVSEEGQLRVSPM